MLKEKAIEELAVNADLVYLSYMITKGAARVAGEMGKRSSSSCVEGHNLVEGTKSNSQVTETFDI